MTDVSVKATIVAVKETPAVSDLLFPAQYRRKALALLLLRPDRPLHVREIARMTATSAGTMAKELDQLQRAGILEKLQVGNQVQFSANTNHPVFPELSALLRKTVGLADVLVEALADVADRIDIAFVFGSVARGAEHAHSDVDLIVVGGVEFGELLGALYPAQQALQREINPKIYSRREWASKLKSGSAFLREVMARPKIFLIGNQHDLDRLGEPRKNRAA
jgi:predicted nucleotidyltransferase